LEEWRHQSHPETGDAGTPSSEKEQNFSRPTPQYQPGSYESARETEEAPKEDPPNYADATGH
jgi:hypothetical protein